MALVSFRPNRNQGRTVAMAVLLAALVGQITYARNAALCADFFSDFANHTKFDYESIQLQSAAMTGENYRAAIDSLRLAPPGAILNFRPGHQFVLDRVLGEGATTIIVRTEDKKVLRINKMVPNALPGTDLSGFVTLQKELADAGVPVVKIDLESSGLPDFLVVEEKNILMTLGEMSRNRPRVPLSDEAMKIARKKLSEFAKKTWKFVYIGDFNDSQIGYDGESWFIFDLGLNNAPLKNHLQRRNIFSSLIFDGDRVPMVDADLEEKFTNMISEERDRKFKSGEWVDTIETYFLRKNIGRKKFDLDLIVDDESQTPGLKRAFVRGEIPKKGTIAKKYLSTWARKNVGLLKDWDDRDALLFDFKKLKEVGASSALYSVRINGELNGLLEVPLSIDGEDQLFSDKAPLLKALGVRKKDLDAVGPDYVLYIRK